MSYTPPAGNAANFTWVGAATYTAPAGNAANFTWAPSGSTGVGSGALLSTGSGAAAHGVSGAGAGALAFVGAAYAEHSEPGMVGVGDGTLDFAGSGVAAHGISGDASGTLAIIGAAAAAHGVAGEGSGSITFIGGGAAFHPRYEVRGEVRLSDVLVNRRVRCYKRESGELVGQADTVAGKYRVPAGFDDGEVYVVAIHLDDAASDWIPPAANRLVPILAEDAA